MAGRSGSDTTAERTFPCDPSSAAAARRFVRETAAQWRLQDDDSLPLLVSELVTNALLHARSEVRVTVSYATDRLRVAVADGSERHPSRRELAASSVTGRGLELVEMLASDWGVEAGRGGKSVWFELPLVDAVETEDRAGAQRPR